MEMFILHPTCSESLSYVSMDSWGIINVFSHAFRPQFCPCRITFPDGSSSCFDFVSQYSSCWTKAPFYNFHKNLNPKPNKTRPLCREHAWLMILWRWKRLGQQQWTIIYKTIASILVPKPLAISANLNSSIVLNDSTLSLFPFTVPPSNTKRQTKANDNKIKK